MSGSGFIGGETIEILIGETIVGTTVTDADGTFFVAFDIPGVASGDLSARGAGSGRSASQSFFIAGGGPVPPGDTPAPGDTTSPVDSGAPPPSDTTSGPRSGERLVAYYSDRDGDFEIYAIDPITFTTYQITDNEVDDRFPAASPDGTRIVFSTGGR